MSKEIGTYPGFEHRIKLAPDAVPVVVKTRPILYALEEKVIATVKLLDEQGIWERADKGDWAHPMLTLAMTPLGLHQYVKMPLGLKDLGAMFQHCIHETLGDCPGTIPYIDDILVYGRTKEEHD